MALILSKFIGYFLEEVSKNIILLLFIYLLYKNINFILIIIILLSMN